MKSYKELIVWQKAIELVVIIYKITEQFPLEEKYGLAAQMRRAAVSIPSNIAEGTKRKDLPEYLQFLRVANASSVELETQIVISKRLFQKLNYTQADELLEEIQKMLNKLIANLKEKKRVTPKT